MNVERCKVKGKRKRPKLSFASIWGSKTLHTCLLSFMGIGFGGALGLALPFKQLYTLQIREMFAKDGVLGPLNLIDWKRVGLMIMYLCGACPFLRSLP